MSSSASLYRGYIFKSMKFAYDPALSSVCYLVKAMNGPLSMLDYHLPTMTPSLYSQPSIFLLWSSHYHVHPINSSLWSAHYHGIAISLILWWYRLWANDYQYFTMTCCYDRDDYDHVYYDDHYYWILYYSILLTTNIDYVAYTYGYMQLRLPAMNGLLSCYHYECFLLWSFLLWSYAMVGKNIYYDVLLCWRVTAIQQKIPTSELYSSKMFTIEFAIGKVSYYDFVGT